MKKLDEEIKGWSKAIPPLQAYVFLAARVKLDLGQKDVEQLTGLDQATVCRIENGKSAKLMPEVMAVFESFFHGSKTLDLLDGKKLQRFHKRLAKTEARRKTRDKFDLVYVELMKKQLTALKN